MGSKIGNNNPTQSFESLAHAFQGVLERPEKKGSYLVGKKTKDKCEIDGVERDVTYLSQKSKKHGPAAAAYRLGRRRKTQYKDASRLLLDLVMEARDERSGFNLDQISAAQSIHIMLLQSRSKGCIKMDEQFRDNLGIVLEGLKTKTLKSAEAVQMDCGGVDGDLSHFLDDVEAIKSGNDSTLAREHIRRQGEGSVQLLDKIALVNRWAATIKIKSKTVSQLTLKSPSFTAPAASTAKEVIGKNLLDKIADWPGSDLQLKMNSLFERAKPEYGPDAFKQACKEVLLELAEQEFILSSLSDEFLNTIEDEEDQEKLRALGDSVKKLLLAFRSSDSPLTRLGDLARAGYNHPKETAQKLVKERAELLDKVPTGLPPPLPVNVQPGAGNGQPAANVPRTPGNVPGTVQGLRPLPATPAAVLPVSGSVPSPSKLAQPAANVVPSALPSLPSIPDGPPPPLPGAARPYDTEASSAEQGVKAAMDKLFPGGPPAPLDIPPPPSNVGQALQPANNLALAGGQPLSLASVNPNPPPPQDDPPALGSVGQASQLANNLALAGGQPLSLASVNPNPPPPQDDPPALGSVGQASQLANNLALAGGQPLSLASVNPNPPPPQDDPPALGSVGQASQLANNLALAGGQPLSLASVNPNPPPPQDDPPAPGSVGQPSQPANNLAPAGGQPPAASNVTPPSGLPADDSGLPLAKPATSGTFVAALDMPPPPEEPPAPSTSAAKLLNDLKRSGTYLTVDKIDDGTGHKVVTKDRVLYLKVASEGLKDGKINSLLKKLPHNRLSQYRRTRLALKALVEDAQIRGLSAAGLKSLLAIKHFVGFKDAASHVQAMLGEDVERQTRAAYSNEVISQLLGSFEQTPIAEPQAAVDEFVAAAGETWKTSVIRNSTPKNVIDYIALMVNHPAFEVDNSAPPADQRIFDMAESMKNAINWGIKIQAAGGKTKSDPDDHYVFSPEFLGATDSFIEKNMSDEFKKLLVPGGGFLSAASSLLASRISGHWKILFGELKNSGPENFKRQVSEFKETIPTQIKKVAYLAQLFTDERYLAIVPVEMRKVFIEFGLGLQDWLFKALDEESVYMKLYQMIAAAAVNPTDVYDRLYPSNPPDRPVPLIPQKPVQAE